MSWKLDPKREHTVLLPFDFSDAATEALTTARGLVARPELMWVLHVVPPISTTSPGFLTGQHQPESLRLRAEAALAKALEQAGLVGVHQRVTIGDPAAEIIDVAKEIDANLIVIPSHGKTGLRRWMIGSVAEKVVRRTPCPVLVLPIRDHDDDDDNDNEQEQHG